MWRTTGRLYSTRSPYWITRKDVTNRDINPQHQKFLMERHAENIKAFEDSDDDELDVAMLISLDAESQITTSSRAKRLQIWGQRILAQVSLQVGDTQVAMNTGLITV